MKNLEKNESRDGESYHFFCPYFFNKGIVYKMNTLPINNALQKLQGNRINYSRAGGGAGSILLIETEGNNSIWIWCYWEILHFGSIIATADDETTANIGKVAIAAKQLEGRIINRIELNTHTYDLHLYIDSEYELIVNNEAQPDDEHYPLNNWELIVSEVKKRYFVTCDLTVIQENT